MNKYILTFQTKTELRVHRNIGLVLFISMSASKRLSLDTTSYNKRNVTNHV
jgi:hypothetical protein